MGRGEGKGGPDGRDSSDQMCAVCYDLMYAGDTLRRINSCGHAFHMDCLDEWLVRAAAEREGAPQTGDLDEEPAGLSQEQNGELNYTEARYPRWAFMAARNQHAPLEMSTYVSPRTSPRLDRSDPQT
ncbi:unnamed protein product [Vitrella brassicaformis CCMP3155]|uniref:RING-type domain-containing protein n=1 Tax=Vitrella brassicaformis (strain CCMP3155) TaxID=1169540 RepID=A0A0G4GBF2_VITBC|nr:unnamed protein product [Vitrella brassicaformis CCMP3155]|eukprot:CEM26296.1 unnamed protein product [Vitrella brassicaformis CCMP3155]